MKFERKKIPRYLSITALIFILLLISVSEPVRAETETCSISGHFNHFSGVSFHLYRVADLEENDGYKLTDAFAGLPNIDLSATTAAETLQQYIAAKQIKADKEVATDAEGKFSVTGLSTGMYLVIGDDFIQEGQRYLVSPTMVSLPSDAGNGKKIYDVTIEVKYTTTPSVDKKSITVQKVWANEGNDTASRPKSVTVQLCNDDGVDQEQTITADDNWTCEWKDLDGGKNWYVTEKDRLNDYTVSITSQDNQSVYVIKNTCGSVLSDEKTESSGDEKTESSGDEKTESSGDEKTESSGDKIPQTGQLWWPAGILLCGGMLMILAGLKIQKK